jgi:hypothetical protein
MRLGLIAAMIVCLALPATAQNSEMNSANALIPMCASALKILNGNVRLGALDSYQAGYCLGIVQTAYNLSPLVKACHPTRVELRQRLRIALIYILKNPARQHEPFELLALKAFREAWPCPSSL